MALGQKTGGGSRKGKPNKATAARQSAIVASGLTPLEFLLRLMRDEENPIIVRLDAAKHAAPYVHPRLTSMDVSGTLEVPGLTEALREARLRVQKARATS